MIFQTVYDTFTKPTGNTKQSQHENPKGFQMKALNLLLLSQVIVLLQNLNSIIIQKQQYSLSGAAGKQFLLIEMW